MPASPEVSVVVGFFNAAPFLDEAVESVLNQTYGSWELLLIDDGSSDGSDAIAQRHAAAQPDRIRYLHHPERANLGTSATRNLGISHARGRYIAALDGDDVYLPGYLERQVKLLEAFPDAAMVSGPCERWYSWTGEPDDAARDFVARQLDAYDVVIEPPGLLLAMLQRLYAVPHGFVVRSAVMQQVGGYEASFPGMYDDQVLLSKICLRYPTYVSYEWGYRYRKHRRSMVMRTGAPGEAAARLRFLNWLADYMRQIGCDDSQLWAVVRDELWKCHHPRLARERQRIGSLSARVRNRVLRAWRGSGVATSHGR